MEQNIYTYTYPFHQKSIIMYFSSFPIRSLDICGFSSTSQIKKNKNRDWNFCFTIFIFFPFFRFLVWIPNTKMAIKKVNFKRDFLCLNFSFFSFFLQLKTLLFGWKVFLYCPLRIVVEAWNCGGGGSFRSTLRSLYLVYWVKCFLVARKRRKELRNWIIGSIFSLFSFII